MAKKSGQAGDLVSQLVFHSIRGQLCVTSPLPPHQLLARVQHELMNLPTGLTQGEVVNRLFARVSSSGNTAWTPRMARLSWNIDGVRVFVHSDSHYIVNPTVSGQFHQPQLVKRVLPKSRWWTPSAEPPQPEASVAHLVLQNLEGNIVVTLGATKDSLRQVVRDVLADPTSRAESNAVAGAIVSALWQKQEVFGSLSLDIGLPGSAANTLWLRHLSGENYAFFEGSESEPSSWEIIGRGFFGPHMDKHLRTPGLHQSVSLVEGLAS